ncbi:hypothetical protein MC885_004644 [Smutsia gigantea]|nr:hypothetical protein MC885_004644 [Smutsia gigantea]
MCTRDFQVELRNNGPDIIRKLPPVSLINPKEGMYVWTQIYFSLAFQRSSCQPREMHQMINTHVLCLKFPPGLAPAPFLQVFLNLMSQTEAPGPALLSINTSPCSAADVTHQPLLPAPVVLSRFSTVLRSTPKSHQSSVTTEREGDPVCHPCFRKWNRDCLGEWKPRGIKGTVRYSKQIKQSA